MGLFFFLILSLLFEQERPCSLKAFLEDSLSFSKLLSPSLLHTLSNSIHSALDLLFYGRLMMLLLYLSFVLIINEQLVELCTPKLGLYTLRNILIDDNRETRMKLERTICYSIGTNCIACTLHYLGLLMILSRISH